MHFAAKLLSRVQARYTVKFHNAYESKLSTHYKIRPCGGRLLAPRNLLVPLYLENRILNQNLKYQSLQKRDIQDIRGVHRKMYKNKAKQDLCRKTKAGSRVMSR